MRVQRHAPAAPYPGKDPVPIVQEAGWASGPVGAGMENLAPAGIRSPDRPAHRQSLYRLRYPAQKWDVRTGIIKKQSVFTSVVTKNELLLLGLILLLWIK